MVTIKLVDSKKDEVRLSDDDRHALHCMLYKKDFPLCVSQKKTDDNMIELSFYLHLSPEEKVEKIGILDAKIKEILIEVNDTEIDLSQYNKILKSTTLYNNVVKDIEYLRDEMTYNLISLNKRLNKLNTEKKEIEGI